MKGEGFEMYQKDWIEFYSTLDERTRISGIYSSEEAAAYRIEELSKFKNAWLRFFLMNRDY